MSTEPTLAADDSWAPPLSLEAARVLGQVTAGLFGRQSETRLDRFMLLRKLGAGGMGEVMLAYDPQLDRKVAIKLMLPARGEAVDTGTHDASLLHEARAAARLHHPNVVSVFEIGRAGDRLFVAMEYVEGRTIRGWLREQPRSVEAILGVFVQAGRGLAAAHLAGLVHRDFKPDNVLVGNDGRVRVADFGIASMVERQTTPTLEGSSGAATLGGGPVGTPRYMAPEQLEGLVVDARADQFAFCVSLWEAVVGAPPFAASSIAELAVKITAGDPDPHTTRLPAGLGAVLRRGLRPLPGDRFADMGGLLDALTRIQAAPRRRRTVIALVVAIGLGGVAARAITPSARGCEEPDADPLFVDDAARTQWAGALAVATASETHGTHALVLLDEFSAAWRTSYAEACAATHTRGERSTAVLDGRMACLERVRASGRVLIDLLSAADRERAWHAIDAIMELPPPAACLEVDLDVDALACVPEIQGQLDRAGQLRELGDAATARDVAEAALAQARTCGAPTILATARSETARLAADLGDDGASARLQDAATSALTEDVPQAVALAALRLADLEGADRGRTATANPWMAIAEAAAARAADEELALSVESSAVRLALATSDVDGADRHATALLLRRRAQFGEDHPRVAEALSLTGIVAQYREQWAQALSIHQQVLAIRTRWYPDTHPIFAKSYNALAIVESRLNHDDAAEAAFRRAIAVIEASRGTTHRELGPPLLNLADLLAQTDRTAEALALADRVEVIARADNSARLLDALDVIRGIAYAESGRLDQAEIAWRRVLELRTVSDGPDRVSTSIAHDSLCRVLVRAERFTEAVEHCRRSVAIGTLAFGAQHPELIQSLITLAEAALGAGLTTEARDAVDRSEAIAKARGASTKRQQALRARIP